MLQLQIPSLLKFVNFQIFCLDKGLSIQEDTSGWKLELKIIHVESKKLIAMWKGIIKKNDRDIQFQLKQSEKKGTKNKSLIQTLSDDNDNPKDKYITAKNVPNGIEVTIYKHKDDPEWTYNRRR